MWERAFVLVPLRELLGRSAQFDRPAWAEVRTRLALVFADAGVVPWAPQQVGRDVS
jgi:hypothetical protein